MIGGLFFESILTLLNLRPSFWPTTPEEIEAHNKWLQERIAQQSFRPLDLSTLKDWGILIGIVALTVLGIWVIVTCISMAKNYLANRNKNTVTTINYKPIGND